MAVGGLLHRLLDGPVASDDKIAERCQISTTASLAAGPGLHQGAAEGRVQLLNQLPGPPIGHAHRATRGGDGAPLRDQLEQIDLSRSDLAVGIEVDPHKQGHHSRLCQGRPSQWSESLATARRACRYSRLDITYRQNKGALSCSQPKRQGGTPCCNRASKS